jgi:hypothetical protein
MTRPWGHSILVAAWHILRHGVAYRDLGRDHFDRLDRDRLIRYHTRRLGCLRARFCASRHLGGGFRRIYAPGAAPALAV